MARAAVDGVADVMKLWRLDDAVFTETPDAFDAAAEKMVAVIAAGNPTGRLAALPPDIILRRLRMALTASLLRHVNDPEAFRTRFGPIHGIIGAMKADPSVFRRVMSFLRDHVPYFGHLASRTFWRTLNNLDADRGSLPGAV